MKLLFDQNISARIVRLLQASFPGCTQVSLVGLYGCSDPAIWDFAKQEHYCIATFDKDFLDILTLRGWPPKVLLIRTGNRRTKDLAARLLAIQEAIHTFLTNEEIGCLEVYA